MQDNTDIFYKEALRTIAGRRVLTNMLEDMGTFNPRDKTLEQQAVANYGLVILQKCGLESVEDFVDTIFNIKIERRSWLRKLKKLLRK